jgi:RNA polymerase sigma-70 factor (ECF subfamily)
MYLTAKGTSMTIESRYHATRSDIAAEEQEIEAAKQNPRAFGSLYNRYYARILQFVYGRTTSKDDARDITQQVFISALETIGRYKPSGVPYSAFLFRVALNELNRFYRKSKVRQAVNIDDEQVSDVLTEMGAENTAETDAKLMQALQQLEPDEMSLMQMRFFDKIPFKDLCTILEISETAAKARVYRLLERLKTIYTSLR